MSPHAITLERAFLPQQVRLADPAAVLHTDLETTLELGLYPFVPGDILAAAALPTAWELVWRTRPRRR